MTDYQKNFSVNKPLHTVYKAITSEIIHWWSNDLTGAADKAGESFIIGFGNTKKTIKILEAIPDAQIVWLCSQAYIDMELLKNKAEWVGTTMVWQLSDNGGQTTVNFVHKGLNESFECFSVCEVGWDMFLPSLQAYLTTGKGSPFMKTETGNEVPTSNL